MTSCNDVQVHLALQPDDRSVTEERRIQAHLAVCADCASRAEAYAEQDRVIGEAPRVTLTSSQRDQLLSIIERKRRRHEMHSKAFTVVGTAVAVMALIALVVGPKLLGPSGPQQLIPGAQLPRDGSEPPTGRTARFGTVDFAVVGHELTGCVTLGSGEGRCQILVEFVLRDPEQVPTAGIDPEISVLHKGQPLPELDFLPEGKPPRSACTSNGTYRDEPCHFWVGATVPADARTQDLAVRASWDDKSAVWPLEEGEDVRVLSEGQFQWPTARPEISGWTFHDPRNPDHPGIDVIAERGEPIAAAAEGVVTFADAKDDYGNLVSIKHEGGWSSRYAQLDEVLVAVGQHVIPGQFVGKAGSTGNSSGPHLHFELHHDGQPVNPLNHLPPASGESFRLFRPIVFADEIELAQRGDAGLPSTFRLENAPSDPAAPRRLLIALHWRVLQAPSIDWRVFAHLEDGGGQLRLQRDVSADWPEEACGEDALNPRCMTTTNLTMTLPTDLPQGTYTVRVGLYDPGTGEHAPVTTGVTAGETSVGVWQVDLPPHNQGKVVPDDGATAEGEIERELAKIFLDDLEGECGWEVLGEDGMQSYVWAICQSPGGTAVSAPAVFHWEASRETVMKIQMPRDGSFYGEDVAELFPLSVQQRILDHDVDMDAIWGQIERDLTLVRGTVVDNALSAKVVTLEDEDGEQWHVPWGAVSRGIHWTDGSRADFRDLERGMTIEVVGFPRPEAATPNVLTAARVTILSEPDESAAPVQDLLLRQEELPGSAPADAGADDWEPTAMPMSGVQVEEDWVANLARHDGCVGAFKVDGARVPARGDGSSTVVYVMNAVYAFETPSQATREYEALLARMAQEAPAPLETLYDGATEGGMEARAVEFEGSEGDGVYWLFGVKEQHLHLLMVNGFDDATRAFFEATMAQVLTR